MDEISALAQVGMLSSLYAHQKPDAAALIYAQGTRSFEGLHKRANRLANHLLDRGLGSGDGIAAICGNGPTFVETLLAAMRIGLRFTPVNWRLLPAEAGYIVDDCEARAIVIDEKGVAAGSLISSGNERIRLASGVNVVGFGDYESLLNLSSSRDPEAPEHGTLMLYTSGTTGMPKGVLKARPEIVLPQGPGTHANYDNATNVALCCGPMYHAGPLFMDVRWPLASGVPIVVMDRFDAEEALGLIQKHRVTHVHMVPTMFQRLLQLPKEKRSHYDLSSLKFVVHGAAPCPREVKREMIEWFGPILTEYYAATEGGGSFVINSHEWSSKPGSVGRIDTAQGACILDDSGDPCAPGQVGNIYLRAGPESRFSYYNDPEKTAGIFKDELFTLGDMGYVDEDGYVFLTGRSAELIISGGVNIYPQEIDNVIIQHPAIADVCTIGSPNEDWGEEVRSIVELRPGFSPSSELATNILNFASSRLAGYKRPRGIEFDVELPRLASGKIQRSKVRERYWRSNDVKN